MERMQALLEAEKKINRDLDRKLERTLASLTKKREIIRELNHELDRRESEMEEFVTKRRVDYLLKKQKWYQDRELRHRLEVDNLLELLHRVSEFENQHTNCCRKTES